MLSQSAYSIPVSGAATTSGVTRYDGAQLASNSPCEDRVVHGSFPAPQWKDSIERGKNSGNHWMTWAVMDGHAGWQTADLLCRALVPTVRNSLATAALSSSQEQTSADNTTAVQQAIARGFVALDTAIMTMATQVASTAPTIDGGDTSLSLADKVNIMMPAWAGSCALLSLYDPSKRELHVACTGDSRAVLGRLKSSDDGMGGGKTWDAVPLSVDQTGKNAEEIARLNAEHPGEEATIVQDGRVLGIMVSRAFGDCRWKWPIDQQKDFRKRFYAPAPLAKPKYDVKTPPYLTAEPVVTTTQLGGKAPCFLILASDGLWDNLSSQEAVDLVGAWLAGRGGNSMASKTVLPATTTDLNSRFAADRNTTVQDGNAAVHLVRNSLGGKDEALLAWRLAYSSPFSRYPRDDITVQVVFFNMDIATLPKA